MIDKTKELNKLKKERMYIFIVVGCNIIIMFIFITATAIQYSPSLISLFSFYLVIGIMSIVVINLLIKVENLRKMSIEKYNDWLFYYLLYAPFTNAFIITGFFIVMMLIYFTLYISYLSIILIIITGLILFTISKPIKRRLDKTKWISKKFLKYDYKYFIVPIETELNKNKINFQKDLIEKVNPFSASIYNVKYELPKGVKITLFTPRNIKSNKDNNIYCWVSIGVEGPNFENKFKFYRELIDDIFDK